MFLILDFFRCLKNHYKNKLKLVAGKVEITSEVIENKSDVFFVEIIGVFFDANSRINRLAGDKKKMPSG